ncbi:MAG: FAD-dependent oxidoreductase, partial [Candidatus Adiutrix sp.]|nr:FAD-dependent oxidoreductase [Candidatus Adiutrix sp.]
MARALVIGGGLSGLGAALLLARLGHGVTLVEKSPRLGTLVRGFHRGGLRFETGFHYAGGLGEGGALRRYLERLGLVRQGLEIRPLPDPGGECLRFPESGADFALPRDFGEFRRLFPENEAVDNFFRRGRAIFQRSPYLNPAVADFDPLAMYGQGPTLAEALERLPLSGRLKSVLGFRCLLYGARPSEASLAQFALVNEPYLHGVHRVEGGGEGLLRAFE